MEWTLVEYEFDDEGEEHKSTVPQDGYVAMRDNTVFTVSRTAGSADDTTYVRVYVTIYVNKGDKQYEWKDWPHSLYLTQQGDFIPDFMSPEDLGGLVELKAGESVQFKLPAVYDDDETQLTDVIYEIRMEKAYPDFTEEKTDEYGGTYSSIPGFYRYYRFKVDEACVDETVAEIPFDDVRMGVYYDLPVIWAVKNKITNGTTFGPDEVCSRGHIVTFLHRAYVESARLSVN